MNIIRPCANFENNADFEFDDGGPSHDWTATSYEYPENEKDFSNIMETFLQGNSNVLQIPNVDVQRLNTEPRFAFNIVLKTLGDYSEKTDNYKPLRMVVSGTAGSGKSYLIKCLVKTIRFMCNSNKSVQVICPTGNSANIISGVNLHSFLKLPITKKVVPHVNSYRKTVKI